MVPEGWEVRVSGDSETLGAWDPSRAVALVRDTADKCVWHSSGDLALGGTPATRYKYAVYVAGRLRRFEALDHHREARSDSLVHDDICSLRRFLPAWVQPDELEISIPAVQIVPLAETERPAAVLRRVVLVDDVSGAEILVDVGRATPVRIPRTQRPSIVVEVSVAGSGNTVVVGRAVVGSRELLDVKRGVVARPAVTATAVLCDISIAFLVVAPMPGQHWDLSLLRGSRPRFDRFIGHRGSGATSRAVDPEKKHVALAENTLASFVQAGLVPGAGGVEFDVHLTADGVPVIYHDISIPVALAPRKHTEIQLATASSSSDEVHVLRVPVNKLALTDVLRLGPGKRHVSKKAPKVVAVTTAASISSEDTLEAKTASHSDGEKEEEEETKHSKGSQLRAVARRRRQYPQTSADMYWARAGSLPTLEEMFMFVPETTGFDVEIKYPDSREVEREIRPVERNAYIDTIAALVIARCPVGNRRWLFYSSFDVDVCTVLAHKQPIHDVFLLTMGNKNTEDDNCITDLEVAIRTAADIGLRGVVTNSRVVLADLTVIERAHALGIALISWGHENGKLESVKQQLSAGLDGIISDFLERVAPFC